MSKNSNGDNTMTAEAGSSVCRPAAVVLTAGGIPGADPYEPCCACVEVVASLPRH